MVSVKAEKGKIYTEIKSNNGDPILEEVGNVIADLLAEFEYGLIKNGNSREMSDKAISEIIGVVSKDISRRVDEKLSPLPVGFGLS